MNHYAWLALELANDRVREAERYRRTHPTDLDRPSRPRRALARVFLASGRASLGIARRLDAVATR